MSITVNHTQLKQLLPKVLKQQLVAYIRSSPGYGKSESVKQIAKEYNLKFIDIRLSTMGIEDLSGLPNLKGDRATYQPFDLFPLEHDKIPEGAGGWLILMDELSSVSLAMQAASYKIILDRQVGQYNLHPNAVVIAAGNKDTDRAVTVRQSTALKSRLIHLELTLNHNDWLKWAVENDLDHRVVSYIRFKPDSLNTFNPDSAENTYSCPRTLHFLSKIIKDEPNLDGLLPLLVGTIGSAGLEFNSYCAIYGDLPTKEDIINNPTGCKFKDEGSFKYAISGYLPTIITKANIASIYQYIERMSKEFQVISLRNILEKDKTLLTEPCIKSWVVKNASSLL